MRRLVFLGMVYVLVAAALLPASLAAQDEATPTSTEQAAPAPTTTAPEPVATVPAPAPAPAPEPATTAPAPAPAPEPAAAPEPQQIAEKPAKKKAAAKAVASASQSVTIQNFAFGPATVTVNVGDTVSWTNQDDVGHTATADGGEFDTGILSQGQSGSATFDTAGTFTYFCQPHPNMKGTVVVQGASTGGTDDGASGDTGGTGSGTGSDTADDGPSLPSTGMDALALGLVGLLMMGLGVGVRRRAAAEGAQPAGRIGW